INGLARVASMLKHLEHLQRGQFVVQSFDLRPWYHYALDRCLGEVKDIVDQLPLIFDQVPAFVAEPNKLTQFFFGVDGGMLGCGFESEQTKHKAPGFVEHPDRRLEDAVEKLHRARYRERDRLGAFERKSLWRKFTEHDVQKRYHREGHRYG